MSQNCADHYGRAVLGSEMKHLLASRHFGMIVMRDAMVVVIGTGVEIEYYVIYDVVAAAAAADFVEWRPTRKMGDEQNEVDAVPYDCDYCP